MNICIDMHVIVYGHESFMTYKKYNECSKEAMTSRVQEKIKVLLSNGR